MIGYTVVCSEMFMANSWSKWMRITFVSEVQYKYEAFVIDIIVLLIKQLKMYTFIFLFDP